MGGLEKMQLGKEVSFTFLLTALLCVYTNAQVDGNFTMCEPLNGSLDDLAVPFPSFPSQFSVQIEAANGQQNATYRAVEYYDGVGQRGRVDYVDQFTLISDFNADQAFHIRYAGGRITDCTAVPLEEDRDTNFTFHEIPGPNGTLQIGSANDFIIPGMLKDQVMYIGQEFVRGVLTDNWQYCFASENGSYLVDYYFAVEGWSFPLNASRVPISATILINFRAPSGEFVITETTYTFTAFDPSPLGDDVFAVPEGVVCKNRKNLKPLPPLDGIKFFSSISQTTVITTKQTTTYPFYYDRQANLVRYDVIYQNKSAGSAPSRISVIHDFTQGVQYLINRDNGFCNVTSLNATGSITPDEVVDDQGNYVIASLLHLLSPYNDSASAYVYEGTSTVRGIDAEAWLAFIPMADPTYPNVTLGNVTYLVYFSRDDWVVNGRNSSKQVLRVRVHGTSIWNGTVANQFDYISDIFSYDLEEPPFEVFDAFVCFPPEQTREAMFTLSVAPTPNTLSLLRSNIRTSLSNFTGSPGSQFGNIQIQTFAPDSIVVNLLLHDPPNAGYMIGTPKNSQTLLDDITAGISSGSLKIRLSDGTMVSPHSLQQPCPSPSPTPSTQALSPTSQSTPKPTTGSISSTTPSPTSSPRSTAASNPTSNSTGPTSTSTSNPTSTPTLCSCPVSAPDLTPTSVPTLNPTSTPTASSSPSLSPSPNPSSTPSQIPNSTPSQSASSILDSTPNLCPSSDPVKTEGAPNIAGIAAGCFFGGFFACLLLGLIVAGIVLGIRGLRRMKSYKVNYSQQLDEM